LSPEEETLYQSLKGLATSHDKNETENAKQQIDS
jgi:hypothetical protein